MDDLLIYEFKPLFLTLDRVGPFQSFYTVDFTDNNNHPCNFFMMVSPNGLGKTTSLEIFSCLTNLLGQKAIDNYGHEDLDKRGGRAQLDFWVRLRWQGKNTSVCYRLWRRAIGEETFLNPGGRRFKNFNAESWHKAGFRSAVTGRYDSIALRSDDLLQDLLQVSVRQRNGAGRIFFCNLRFICRPSYIFPLIEIYLIQITTITIVFPKRPIA
jgi:hypothetical protein